MKKDATKTDQIMPIFVINLKKDHDKFLFMQKQFTQLGLKCTRVEAVEGNTLDPKALESCYSDDEAIQTIGRRLSLPELGTVLSHLSIYQNMLDTAQNTALILEDDVTLSSELPRLLASLDGLPKDWDVVLLGHHPAHSLYHDTAGSFWGRSPINDNFQCIRFAEFPFGAYGYLVSLSGAKKLLQALSTIREPIDQYTGNARLVNLFGISPTCVKVNPYLLAYSNLSEERDLLNASIKTHSPRPVRLIKKIVTRVPGQKELRQFLRRCLIPSMANGWHK